LSNPVETANIRVMYDNRKPVGFLGLSRNITERKQAQETLRAKSETLFKFSTLVPGMLYQFMRRTDGTYCVPFTNEAIRGIFGCSPDDVKNDFSPISRAILPDDLPKVIESIETSARGLTRWECEYRVQIPGQPIRTLWGQSIPEKQHDGCIIWHGFNADITEHKKTEEAIRTAAEEWRNTFDSIKDMVALVDVNHTIQRVNQTFAKALHLEPQTLIGKHCYKLIHGMDQPHPMCPHARTLESSHFESSEYFDENLKLWVEATSSPIFGDNGHLTGAVHIIKDITERKQAEADNQQLRDKAEMSSRLAAIGEMAAGIAHEINNPLTGVIGFSQLLEERPDLPSDAKDQLRVIADGGNRVKDIVRRMLTFARQTKPMRTSGNINELIEASLGIRSYVLRTANIEVVKHLDPDLPWVVVDPGQMQQVFLNLIVNAEYAMKKAHGKGTLTIITKKIDDHIRISFKDDGTGMSQETKDKLFHPFFTTKDVGEGTGLGLGLSRSIILEHDGTIEVESQPDQGATFVIMLPITQPVEVAPVEVVTAAPVKKVKTGRILVVDDEVAIRSLVSMILAKSGHIVDSTGDAAEVLTKLKSSIYDAVLMDIRMPGMSGMELYAKVMEIHPELKDKFIFITGDTSDTQTRIFLEQNKLSHISKPFDRETLLKKVEGLL
jgi:PAS domain S-box-containing protein